jgi:hypothetical protein
MKTLYICKHIFARCDSSVNDTYYMWSQSEFNFLRLQINITEYTFVYVLRWMLTTTSNPVRSDFIGKNYALRIFCAWMQDDRPGCGELIWKYRSLKVVWNWSFGDQFEWFVAENIWFCYRFGFSLRTPPYVNLFKATKNNRDIEIY